MANLRMKNKKRRRNKWPQQENEGAKRKMEGRSPTMRAPARPKPRNPNVPGTTFPAHLIPLLFGCIRRNTRRNCHEKMPNDLYLLVIMMIFRISYEM